jgi:hypothetical protein
MRKTVGALFWICCLHAFALAGPAFADDQVYFPATQNVTNILVQKINAETVRLDISSWYLSEHAVSIAIANRFAAGVPVRLMGDRGAIFEADPHTKAEFYWLANKGVPIRLRFNPSNFPEIDHWKMALFVGQNTVAFGSANFAPVELAPVSSTNYNDETVMFTDDPTLVNAFKTKFDVMWNDTTKEPESIISGPPYFKDWYDACATEPTGNCKDFATLYPTPAPMVVNRSRLEGDNPSPVDLIWGQGPDFNNRLTSEINNENTRIDLVVYRLEVDNITNALLAKFRAGVPVRVLVDPKQYTNPLYPEYWLTHANVDKLWAAGVPIRQTMHAGVTHMKTLVTSTYATNASSNYGPNWQRDHDYFVSKATKSAIYQAIADRVDAMWNDTAGFGPLITTKPIAATQKTPANAATGVATTTPLVWNIAAYAVSYDVYMGTSASTMTLAGNVAAKMVTNPPSTYSFTPAAALQPGTTYFWKVVSRTNATPIDPTMIATSATWSFTTAGTASRPPAPTNPNPAAGATGVSTGPVLSWTGGGTGTTNNVSFGTANPPAQVATGLTATSYTPGTLAAGTTYFWQVTSVGSGGSTPGPIWSFATGSGGGAPPEVVIYAADVLPGDIHGAWTLVADSTAAAGTKLSTPDAGVAALSAALASPTNYFDASFQAVSGRRYRVWLRMHAINNSKYNDSVFVQFSDSTNSSGGAVYRTGTTGALLVNLATDANATSLQGWGWARNAYWLSDTGDVWFPSTGTHTIRVQVREDGVEIDQIVISPVTYVDNSPGSVSNDTTIVPKPGGQAPASPGSPSPANAATGVSTAPTLTWSASGATSYDVNFGTANPPPLVSSGQSAASYTASALANSTTYFWQVIAKNASGTTPGPVWSFTTAAAAPPPPGAPGSPNPPDTATSVSTTPTLTWSASGATTYDVSFGTGNPPPQVSSGQSAASYTPSALANSTTYFWQVVARNTSGTTSGPVWSFTTSTAAPPPPGAPGSPNPADTATSVSTAPTLTWSASGATAYDVSFGTANPPPQVSTGQASASYKPAVLQNNTTYFWQVVAKNSGGATSGPVWSFTTSVQPTPEIVIYASDIPAASLHGAWAAASDPTSPNGVKLATPDAGFATTNNPLAAPVHYIDITFTADANTPYRLWLRMQALNNNKYNDSLWVQFSDAMVNGASIYPINTTSGLDVNLATDVNATSLNAWGWQNGAYWLSQPTTLTFPTSGTHTMRIQVREDGVQFDQIVLSSARFLSAAPGGPTNDSTIVPKP